MNAAATLAPSADDIAALAAAFEAAQDAYDRNTDDYHRAKRAGDDRAAGQAMTLAIGLSERKGNAQAALIRAQRQAAAWKRANAWG